MSSPASHQTPPDTPEVGAPAPHLTHPSAWDGAADVRLVPKIFIGDVVLWADEHSTRAVWSSRDCGRETGHESENQPWRQWNSPLVKLPVAKEEPKFY